ncbi:rhodanese-like domain-containing protein [Nitrosophilus kaiyonis]|uniref:rhodanese-like domain-containing protein n=1 Tax=Nitrosophilus kaiyonis TaxID=2930200 RepID=UPI00248FB017|nr:rhodanese-like domain-containing protein [Nitrosophilus kaiyonis]
MGKLTEFEQTVAQRIKEQIELNKQKDELGNVDLQKAMELVKEAGAILLDVRPPAKVTGENAEEADIPDAYYTPYNEFTEYLDILPEDKTTVIVTACLKGLFASRVKAYLEVLGYENVFVFTGNIEDWIASHKAHKGEI